MEGIAKERYLVSRQELIQTFGFSARLVQDLGRPDYVRANRNWGVTYLYDLERVEVFAQENVDRIERILAARPRRRESARKVSHRSCEETIQWSRTVPIVLAPIPPVALEYARRYFAPLPLTRQRALLYLRLAARRHGADQARLVLQERVELMLAVASEAKGIALLVDKS